MGSYSDHLKHFVWSGPVGCLFYALQTKRSAAKLGRIRHKPYRIPEFVPLHDICAQKWSGTACSSTQRDFQETQKRLEEVWIAVAASAVLPVSAARKSFCGTVFVHGLSLSVHLNNL